VNDFRIIEDMRTRLNSMEIMLIIHRGISVKLSGVEENVKIVFCNFQ